MTLAVCIKKRSERHCFINIFSMANVHYFNHLIFIVYITNQPIITHSISPEISQATFKSMSKKTRILGTYNMGRNICSYFLLNRPVNFIKFFFGFFVEADLPEGRLTRQVCVSLQRLQKECLHHFLFPFPQVAEMQLSSLSYLQKNPQGLSEHNSLQNDVFLTRDRQEEFLIFLGGQLLT